MRVKKFDIGLDFILNLLGPGRKKFDYEIENALPEDARVVGVSTDCNVNPSMVSLFITSESFPNVMPGAPLQSQTFMVTQYHGDPQGVREGVPANCRECEYRRYVNLIGIDGGPGSVMVCEHAGAPNLCCIVSGEGLPEKCPLYGLQPKGGGGYKEVGG